MTQQKSHLTLYKASAGSGKTFMLTVRYIALLAQNPQSYRNILAVTFTNKATAEMKQRILSQLYGINHSLEDSQSYFNKVREHVPSSISDVQIRRNAGVALTMILQDYGHFRVETIDSFFQSVLRGLARELQLGSNMRIELDSEQVVSDAVDAFLEGIDTHDKEKAGEYNTVLDFVQDNIDDDKGWKIDNQLKKFSMQLFSELFIENKDKLKDVLENNTSIRSYSRMLKERRSKLEKDETERMKRFGETLRSKLGNRGYSIDALPKNQCSLVSSIIDGSYLQHKEEGKTISNCIDKPEALFRAADAKKDPTLAAFAASETVPLLGDVLNLYRSFNREMNSINASLGHLNELSLIIAVRREITRQNNEQGRFVLADTAPMLSVLAEGDTSFVFEKTGSFIRHMMIDEFQDTSRMQWRNLHLLILECLSHNSDCLVVGDVKQSIYRWRNSDWNILNTEIEESFSKYAPHTEPLTANRRSCEGIVSFNNKLFSKASKYLQDLYSEEFTDNHHDALRKAYEDVEQQCPVGPDGKTAKLPGGNVHIRMLGSVEKGEDRNLLAVQMVEQELDRLTSAGVAQGDITILTRNKKHISQIANYFAQNRPEYRMVSGEAFQLDSSCSVRILTNALRWIADDKDQAALAAMLCEWRRCILKEEVGMSEILCTDLISQLPSELAERREKLRNVPMYELVEHLYRLLRLNNAEGQDAYILSFLDIVREYSANQSTDIADFITAWDDKLHKRAIQSEGDDSIRLMTIHKSKGLEFHTVIIPFCDWKIKDSREQLWSEPNKAPYNDIRLLPLDFSSKLGNSIYSDDYRIETGRQMVDNLNLLYVAATRARCNLSILSADPSAECVKANDIIINSLLSDPDFSQDSNDVYLYESGEIVPHSHEEGGKKESGNPFDAVPTCQELPMTSFVINARFKQSGDSQRFTISSSDKDEAANEEKQESYIENGKLLHQLLSSIRTAADIDREVRKLLSEGLIESAAKAESTSRLMTNAISKPEVSAWFDGHWTLFNETSVLFRNNGMVLTRRPDRVMTDGQETIVVDFKFGRRKEEHMHQVQEYMGLLRDMGFLNVRGYVWYVYNGEIINC